MPTCPDCGRDLGQQATVCFVCGAALTEEGEPDASLLDAGRDAADRLRRLASDRSESVTDLWETAQENFARRLTEIRDGTSEQVPSLLAFLHTDDLLRWLDTAYSTSHTQYDRAMDAAFLAKQRAGELGYSVGQHRLFDGGHTLRGSFERAQEAVQNDSSLTEVVEWSRAYMNDLTTPSGMPITTLDPAEYERWATAFSETVPGLDQQYLFDLLNFDAMELVASEIAVIGAIFALSDDDLERLSELLGAMGVNAIVAANPIMGMLTIASTAYAYWRYETVAGTQVVKGGSLAGVSALVFVSLGAPVLVELVVAVVVAHQLRQRVFENEEFVRWLRKQAKKQRPSVDELLAVLPESAALARRLRGPEGFG